MQVPDGLAFSDFRGYQDWQVGQIDGQHFELVPICDRFRQCRDELAMSNQLGAKVHRKGDMAIFGIPRP